MDVLYVYAIFKCSISFFLTFKMFLLCYNIILCYFIFLWNPLSKSNNSSQILLNYISFCSYFVWEIKEVKNMVYTCIDDW